ncbi:MAG: hypothetical protein ABJH05_00145 [Fulvivirga sp.]
MKNYDPKNILISQHIPKCGGSSFDNILRKWFGLGFFTHYYNHKRQKPAKRIPFVNWFSNFKPVCVHGHFDKEKDGKGIFDYYPETTQIITFLRDPLEVQLSMYFYMRKLISEGSLYWQGEQIKEMKYGGDIDAWVEQRPLYMLRFLPEGINSSNYKEILQKYFVHIGIVEEFQQSVDVLAKKLGKQSVEVPLENTTKRDLNPSNASVKVFEENHKLEYNIYNFAFKKMINDQ